MAYRIDLGATRAADLSLSVNSTAAEFRAAPFAAGLAPATANFAMMHDFAVRPIAMAGSSPLMARAG